MGTTKWKIVELFDSLNLSIYLIDFKNYPQKQIFFDSIRLLNYRSIDYTISQHKTIDSLFRSTDNYYEMVGTPFWVIITFMLKLLKWKLLYDTLNSFYLNENYRIIHSIVW